MSLSIFFILSIATINIVLGYVIFSRNRTIFANKAFLGITIFLTLWMLANFFISVVTNSVAVNLLNGVAYSFGFLAIFLSFLFSQSYPVESKFIGNRKALITSIAAALIFSIFNSSLPRSRCP